MASVPIRNKVAEHFQAWINGEKPLPRYVKEARTVMLSKDGT